MAHLVSLTDIRKSYQNKDIKAQLYGTVKFSALFCYILLSIVVYRMYFRLDTEAEFAAHLAIGWQLYKLHTLRLRYGCGIWRYTCTVIPHEPLKTVRLCDRGMKWRVRRENVTDFATSPVSALSVHYASRTNGRSRFTVGQRFIEEN